MVCELRVEGCVELEEGRKALPRMNPTEKLVSVQKPDGSFYLAACDPNKPAPDVPGFQDRHWRAVQVGGAWSHGITAKGERIIEDGGARACAWIGRRVIVYSGPHYGRVHHVVSVSETLAHLVHTTSGDRYAVPFCDLEAI
jgi:hypothetical protein